MKFFRLTPRAHQDLKNIGKHTLKTWGREQREVYLSAMEQRFEWLAQHSDRGRHRPDIQKSYYSYLQGSHIIFYLKREDGIDIIGILHQRMDVRNLSS